MAKMSRVDQPEEISGDSAARPPEAGEASRGGREDLDEVERLRQETARLRAALKDIVALALSSGDAKQRLVQMHRRAVAELSQVDPHSAP